MLRWPSLWKRGDVFPHIWSKRNADKNASVWVYSSQRLLSSSGKILKFVGFYLNVGNRSWQNMQFRLEQRKKGHKPDVSILLILYAVTFPDTQWPASLCSRSCTVNWRKAADSGTLTHEKQQQVQIFFSPAPNMVGFMKRETCQGFETQNELKPK